MPIYEYKCKSCETSFEALRSMRDESPASCPRCGGGETMRLLSLFAARTGSSDACETSAAWGGPCCRTISPGGG